MFPEALVEECLILSLGEIELSGKEYRRLRSRKREEGARVPKSPSRANANDYTFLPLNHSSLLKFHRFPVVHWAGDQVFNIGVFRDI